MLRRKFSPRKSLSFGRPWLECLEDRIQPAIDYWTGFSAISSGRKRQLLESRQLVASRQLPRPGIRPIFPPVIVTLLRPR